MTCSLVHNMWTEQMSNGYAKQIPFKATTYPVKNTVGRRPLEYLEQVMKDVNEPSYHQMKRKY